MEILFVSSGNSSTGISPIIKNQQDSLIQEGLTVVSFPIVGSGILGYLKGSFSLRKQIKLKHYDLVHAHYSLSGYAATLAGCKPLIVSLMGSDTKSGYFQNLIIRALNKMFWSACIVKSKQMKNAIGIKNAIVIPNGVNFSRFYPIPQNEAIKKLNFKTNKKHILFAANPKRPEKNYKLTNDAIKLLPNSDIEVHFLKNIPNEEAVWYYCASDIIILTSIREGSPNVIKEAMACNRPIIATDVGDIKEIFGSVNGCYICDFTAEDLVKKINSALLFGKQTKGREQINYLNSELIAKKLKEIYEQAK